MNKEYLITFDFKTAKVSKSGMVSGKSGEAEFSVFSDSPDIKGLWEQTDDLKRIAKEVLSSDKKISKSGAITEIKITKIEEFKK